MCGRFTLTASPKLIEEAFGQFEGLPGDLKPRYNIAPTQLVLALRRAETAGVSSYAFLRWGLVPQWADDPSIGNRLINARAEGVADKPSFRSAFKRRRCLVLADGFYEWLATGERKAPKQPYAIHRADRRPFALAGLWERWAGEVETIESCTIITTSANATMKPLHDRMPVILDPRDYDRWIDPTPRDPATLLELLRPCPDDWLIADPVSTFVNNPRNEGPDCLRPT